MWRICGFRDPDRFAPSGEPVHQNEPGAFATFAAARAVAKEIAKAIGFGIRIIISAGRSGLIVIDGKATGQVTLMGDVVEPRRAFIQDNALNVENLDF